MVVTFLQGIDGKDGDQGLPGEKGDKVMNIQSTCLQLHCYSYKLNACIDPPSIGNWAGSSCFSDHDTFLNELSLISLEQGS